PVEPSGTVASVSRMAARLTTPIANVTWRRLNGPTPRRRGGRTNGAGDSGDADVAGADGPGSASGSGTRPQIWVLNGTYCGSSASQLNSIATPIRATSTPPIAETSRPRATSGPTSPGARSYAAAMAMNGRPRPSV